MDRRAFISGATAGLLAAPLAAGAQSRAGVARIGLLTSQSLPGRGPGFVEFYRQPVAVGDGEIGTHLIANGRNGYLKTAALQKLPEACS